ncbi:cysteine desulfurase family protein [Aciditerrimonas ferrireducens]|uniref:Cysteine desulfurase family protein n=1 Tax=Aciditerrimonas ferrireducens TaxID=667306 RepID=A0ABV6C2J6_9ACTN
MNTTARAGRDPGGAPVYLDHAASSPLRPEALEAMLPWLAGQPANPAGSHRVARRAKAALEDAREQIAAVVGCRPDELVFTSGGTEAANLGVHAARDRGRLLCSAIEHAAVLEPCRALGGATVPVEPTGILDLAALAEALDSPGPPVALVAVMAVNNELGTVQPVPEVVAQVARAAPGALVLCDAVAALPWVELPELTQGCALVALSAHKVGGPPGIGALVVRRPAQLAPLLRGGSQERGRRPGTVPVALAVGMAAALQAAWEDRVAARARLAALRRRLVTGLVAEAGAVPTLGAAWDSAAVDLAHLRFPGVAAQELVVGLDVAGVCASVGAACASGAPEPSHVLTAIGLPETEARTGLRFSLGWTTSGAEVERALAVVPGVVRALRSKAPGDERIRDQGTRSRGPTLASAASTPAPRRSTPGGPSGRPGAVPGVGGTG